MRKSSKIQAKMQELQQKYKNNPEKLNQEMMELYKTEKMNPFSGCFSSIIQLLIILSVFWLVSQPLTYMKKVDPQVIENYKTEIQQENGSSSSYYPEIEIIEKKGAEDENVYINMDFLGIHYTSFICHNFFHFYKNDNKCTKESNEEERNCNREWRNKTTG